MILYVTLDKNDWIENNIRCNDIGQFFTDAWEGIKATISDPKFWTQTAVAAALAVATGGQSIWVQAIVTGSGYTMTGEGYDFAGTGFDVEKFYELKGVDNAGEYWGGALFDCVLSSGDIYVGRKAFEYVKGGKGAGGTGGKTGYDYLDDQLGSLKGKVKINRYDSSESVNSWWKEEMGYASPPYTPKTMVQDIILNSDEKFIRVYDGDVSGLKGGWVMRADDIKGLTPSQIQDKFALPATPKYIGQLDLKSGSNIRMGEVNPNFGFKGGGIQFDLKGQYFQGFIPLGTLEEWSKLR